MKPKFDRVLDHCLETGITFGLNRAFKYEDNPSKEVIMENIMREVSNQFYEWFDIEGMEE